MAIKLVLLAGAALMTAPPAFAQDAPADSVAGSAAAPAAPQEPAAAPPKTGDQEIIVTGHLDAARASIQPSLGATTYSITNATIQALPGGDDQQFNQVMLQLPGVSQDGFGQFHVRDDHDNLQYRINGTILPEGVAVFGQTLSPRLVENLDLKTGALPAQYGLRTAGIIDITTKSSMKDGGNISLYGGSHDTIEPSLEYGGSSGNTNYYVTGSYLHDDLGIEAVDSGRTALHDSTDQYQAFALVDHTLDGNNRISFIGGYSNQYFQIPNPRGLEPTHGYDVDGQTDFLSNDLNERQLERTAFAIVSFLHDSGPFTVQASLFSRYSGLDYYPDTVGELLFNGLAQRATLQDITIGSQVEAVYRLGEAHTLRGGVVISRDHSTTNTDTQVFPIDGSGAQTGPAFSILDNTAATEMTYSVYLQDEWKLLPHVVLNFGGRFDRYEGYRAEQQFSPRINAVWTPTDSTTVHIGYARYFTPPPFANVATSTVDQFKGTSGAAPSNVVGTTPYAERQNYFDIGIEQKISPALSVGIDAYHRRSRNLIDEGQFGAPIILTPFNYAKGRIDGIEGNISYNHGPLMAYANFAYAKAQGTDIVSSQFNFTPADLAYIQTHYIYLDHDQTYTASAGASYKFDDGVFRGSKVGATMIYGSGLRRDEILAGGSDVPNGAKMPPYAVFNLTVSHKFERAGVEVRADVINLLDHIYEIRDGTGVGVGAPEFGARRGFFVGVSKDF
jgi:outer membrane receptor for ferrienterochelin and colicins